LRKLELAIEKNRKIAIRLANARNCCSRCLRVVPTLTADAVMPRPLR
jgi:hypothetical protein